MKKYVVFAGVNGSGKTTLYKTNNHIQNMLRVNIDEIVREFGTWRNADDVARAGRIAVKLIKKYFDEGISFNQETTLCGKSIVQNIKNAKQKGYFIDLYFVELDSPYLAKKRVAQRVLDGGLTLSNFWGAPPTSFPIIIHPS